MATDPAHALWGRNGGLYLGWDVGPKGRIDLRDRPAEITTNAHVVMLGVNGVGKSRRFVIPQLLKLLGWSIVVPDFKGELYNSTARFRAAHGCKNIVINPYGLHGIPSDGCDPIANILQSDGPDFVDECDALAAILAPNDGGENRHFDEGAQDLASIPLMYAPKAGSTTMFDVRQLLNLGDKALAREMQAIGKAAAEAGFVELNGRAERFKSILASDKELKSVYIHRADAAPLARLTAYLRGLAQG